MNVKAVPLPTMGHLVDFVRETLCAHDRLEVETTPFFVGELKRAGQICGYMFHIEGPRLLKNSAIWTDDEHRIIFYDSTGTRYHEVRLSDSPPIEEVRKRAA